MKKKNSNKITFAEKKQLKEVLKLTDLSHYIFEKYNDTDLFIPVLQNLKKILIVKFIKKSFNQLNDSQLENNYEFLNQFATQYDYSIIKIETSLNFNSNINFLNYKSQKIINPKIKRINYLNQQELVLAEEETSQDTYLYITYETETSTLIDYLFNNQNIELLSINEQIHFLQQLSFKRYTQV